MRRFVVILVLGGCLVLSGCSRMAADLPTTSDVSTATSQNFDSRESSKQAEALAANLADGTITSAQMRDKANGAAFVFLASSSGDPKVVVQALEGMAATFTSEAQSQDKNIVDQAYVAAVLKNMGAEDKAIRYWAIQCAALTQIGDADGEVAQALNRTARDDAEMAARYEALGALARNRSWSKNNDSVDTFTLALKDRALVASEALFRLDGRGAALPNRQSLHRTVVGLLAHEDPGVRGRAAAVAPDTVSESDQPALVTILEAMLTDESAYVRSEAAQALADLHHLPSTAKLIPLLDDKEKNTYDLRFDDLLGGSDTQHHDGSAWSRTDDAALWAMQTMTAFMKEQKFVYGKIDGKTVNADIAREVKFAKDWYGKNKAALNG